MFERARARLASAIEVLEIPDKVRRMETTMSELRDAYNAVAGAVDEATGELDTLANRIAELEGAGDEGAAIATDLRALAGRLSNAYTPPAEVPNPVVTDPDVEDPAAGGGDATPPPADGGTDGGV